jgi:hypothetical protein
MLTWVNVTMIDMLYDLPLNCRVEAALDRDVAADLVATVVSGVRSLQEEMRYPGSIHAILPFMLSCCVKRDDDVCWSCSDDLDGTPGSSGVL